MPLLPTRTLGKNGPQVTALGFGIMGLSAFYGEALPDEKRFQVLDHAHKVGEHFWDSADIYGDNEELIGEWFKRTGNRDDVFLATKFGNELTADGNLRVRSDLEYVAQACEKSLQRLGVETIDLYYCHRLDGKTSVEKTVEAMAQLKAEGKIKYLGLSEVSSKTLRRAHAIHPITAVQMEYSPFALDIEQEGLLNTCRELGVALVAYSPLGRGLVTGAYKSRDDFEEGDFRRSIPRFSDENFPKNLKLVEELKQIAGRKGHSAGQITLAFLLAQGEDIFPIPGTKSIKYLDENLAALEIKLSSEELQELRTAVDSAEVYGGRYNDAMAAQLFVDTPEL